MCSELPRKFKLCGKKATLVHHPKSPKVDWAGGCRIGLKRKGKIHKGKDVFGTGACSGSCIIFPVGYTIRGSTNFIGVKNMCNLDDRLATNGTSTNGTAVRRNVNENFVEEDDNEGDPDGIEYIEDDGEEDDDDEEITDGIEWM